MNTLVKALSVSLLSLSSYVYSADNIVLKLDMFINDDLVKPFVLEGMMDEKFTAQIDGEVKYEIVPTMEHGAVKLSAVYYTFADGAYTLKEKPVLVTALNEVATIEIGSIDDKVYKIQITPQSKM